VRLILAEAVELARGALLELQPAGVGEHLGVTAEDECAATHRFASTLSGYRGWQWAVVVAAPPQADRATVSESALLPGPDALVAPEFLPWEQRVRPGDLAPGDLLAPLPSDPRLVPGYLVTGDPVVDEVAEEIGQGRSQVLSREGREEAAERWFTEYGPDTDMARAAPSTCRLCGFFVPLAGALRAAYGVCANTMGADGHVVHAEYGCGAHSDTELPTGGGSPLYEAYDDAAVELISPEELRGQSPVAEAGVAMGAESAMDKSAEAVAGGAVESRVPEGVEAAASENAAAVAPEAEVVAPGAEVARQAAEFDAAFAETVCPGVGSESGSAPRPIGSPAAESAGADTDSTIEVAADVVEVPASEHASSNAIPGTGVPAAVAGPAREDSGGPVAAQTLSEDVSGPSVSAAGASFEAVSNAGVSPGSGEVAPAARSFGADSAHTEAGADETAPDASVAETSSGLTQVESPSNGADSGTAEDTLVRPAAAPESAAVVAEPAAAADEPDRAVITGPGVNTGPGAIATDRDAEVAESGAVVAESEQAATGSVGAMVESAAVADESDPPVDESERAVAGADRTTAGTGDAAAESGARGGEYYDASAPVRVQQTAEGASGSSEPS
jgi:hypothetical protein